MSASSAPNSLDVPSAGETTVSASARDHARAGPQRTREESVERRVTVDVGVLGVSEIDAVDAREPADQRRVRSSGARSARLDTSRPRSDPSAADVGRAKRPRRTSCGRAMRRPVALQDLDVVGRERRGIVRAARDGDELRVRADDVNRVVVRHVVVVAAVVVLLDGNAERRDERREPRVACRSRRRTTRRSGRDTPRSRRACRARGRRSRRRPGERLAARARSARARTSASTFSVSGQTSGHCVKPK